MLDIIIANGTLVNADKSIRADLAVKDGKIVAIGDQQYFPPAKEFVDATGKLVMPGLIDSHVHINLDMGEFVTLDTVENATLSAAYGGMTSMVEFAVPVGDQSPLAALEKTRNEANGHSLINYSFHSCITRLNDQSVADIKDIISAGIPSVKMFTIYKETVMLEMLGIYEILKEVGKRGALAKIHAENAPMIEALIAQCIKDGRTTPYWHAKSRPPASEASAVAELIPMIQETGAAVQYAHMTSSSVRDTIYDAKRRGLPVYTEFCPHYLVLGEEVYSRPDAENFVCSPPMRSAEDRAGLWKMVSEGLCDVISSDHSAYDTKQKQLYKEFFPKMPNGLPGIETRAMVMFSEGVSKGRMSENEFVRMLSTNDAKLMGMYPEKGILAVGADADIILIDPTAQSTLSIKNLHMQTDYTPFEGLELTGKITDTIINGTHIIKDGVCINDTFRGAEIRRHSPDFY